MSPTCATAIKSNRTGCKDDNSAGGKVVLGDLGGNPDRDEINDRVGLSKKVLCHIQLSPEQGLNAKESGAATTFPRVACI